MSGRDPKGYYRRLGLSPAAADVEIKAAFRRLAKACHPDRNPSPTAALEFREISEAYAVLSDPAARAAYDLAVEAGDPPSQPFQSDAPEPIACSSCGKVSAQPRYVIFYRVRSFLVFTRRYPIQGIFCPACSGWKAVSATMATWLFGWWGVPWGPVYSAGAIFQNLFGGKKPAETNTRLLLHHAWIFWKGGKIDLSAAIAADALEFSNRIKPHLRREEMRKEIAAFLAALERRAPVTRLKRPRQRGLPFLLQGGMVVAAIVAVVHLFAARQRVDASPRPAVFPAPRVRSFSPAAPIPDGRPPQKREGRSKVTIDNSENSSDVFVKIFSLDTSPPSEKHAFRIGAHEKFTVRHVDAGRYDMRYRDLNSGALFRSEPFELKEFRDSEGINYTYRSLTMVLHKTGGGNVETYQISEKEFDSPR